MSEQISFSQVILGGTTLSFGVPTKDVSGLASLGITAPAANTTSLTLSGGSHTGSDATSDVSIATTWNTTGVPTAFLLNVTNTASAPGAKLIDLQINGASKVNVTSSGKLTANSLASDLLSNSAQSFTMLANSSGAVTLASASNSNLMLSAPGTGTIRLGLADNAAPVAQTLGVQGVVAGTSNTAGADFTLAGSKGTGDHGGGSLLFKVAPAGSSGTAQNALATALTIDSTKAATFAGNVNMTAIPTADPHVVGQLWANAGVLTISAG